MSKLTAKTATSTPVATDLIHVVINPGTTPASRKCTVDDFFKSRTGNYNVLAYASLSAAITALGATAAQIEISVSTAVTASLTIPSNISLILTGNGMLNVSASQTLTINGSLIAPIRQIFTGSGNVRFGGNIPVSFPQWFGAAADNATDDSAAVQKAIDAFAPVSTGPTGGFVQIVGPTCIASTITIQHSNPTIRGGGWAPNKTGERLHTFLRWTGSAGSPMILIHNLGGCIENLHLIGKSTAKPSAAIEISETSIFCDNTCLRDVWIGSMYGFDDDNAVQFDRGVYLSGTLDGDTNHLERVFIHKCTTGLEISNPNAALTHCSTFETIECVTGVKTSAPQLAITNWIAALNDVDLELAAQGVDVTLRNYVSEGSGRMAKGSAVGPLRLVVDGGSFQCDGGGKFATGQADYSGKRAFLQFKTTSAGAGLWLEVKNFNLQQVSSPATPVIQAWNTSDNTTPNGVTQVFLRLDGVKGFTSANIDLGSDGYHSSSRTVEFSRQANNAPVAPQISRFIQFSAYGSEDGAFEDLRYDFTGKVNVYGGPLKVKSLPTISGTFWSVTPTGSGATTYSYRVSALTHDGETLASVAKTCVNNATLSGSAYNTIAIAPHPGATAYKIYGRTSGSELLMKTITVAEVADTSQVVWADTGSVTPSGAVPAVNNTGNASVDGTLRLGTYTTTQRDAIPSPANGMVIYNSTTSKIEAYAGGAWVALH